MIILCAPHSVLFAYLMWRTLFHARFTPSEPCMTVGGDHNGRKEVVRIEVADHIIILSFKQARLIKLELGVRGSQVKSCTRCGQAFSHSNSKSRESWFASKPFRVHPLQGPLTGYLRSMPSYPSNQKGSVTHRNANARLISALNFIFLVHFRFISVCIHTQTIL